MFRIRVCIHRLLAAGAVCIVLLACAAVAQDTSNLPYTNPKLSPEERAADLVHRMTLEGKTSQLVNQARAIRRLGVPAYDWWSEALHGVFANGITEFPEPIGLAATFDTPRIHEMATAIGIEGRIKHAQDVRAGHSNQFEGLDFWAPNINIFRDPRGWGDPPDASVTVTNTGKVAGDEVAQLYLKFPDVPGAPIRVLRGFERIHLEPGASQNVEFHLNARDLRMVTDLGDIIEAQGKYTLSVGGGQPGTDAPSVSGNFEIHGQLAMPE